MQKGTERNSLSRLANPQGVCGGQAKENPTCFVWQFSIFGGVGTERKMKKFSQISVIFALRGVVGSRERNIAVAHSLCRLFQIVDFRPLFIAPALLCLDIVFNVNEKIVYFPSGWIKLTNCTCDEV